MNKKLIVEAEVKFLISKNKYKSLLLLLDKKIIKTRKEEYIEDYFKNIKKTKLGWSFKRWRLIDGKKFLITEKKWSIDKKGNKVRLEDEHEITKASFNKSISKGIKAKLSKKRSDYSLVISGLKATISLDHLIVKNNSSYFIECEVMTSINKSFEVRNVLTKWLEKELHINIKGEAPSMLDLLQKNNLIIK